MMIVLSRPAAEAFLDALADTKWHWPQEILESLLPGLSETRTARGDFLVIAMPAFRSGIVALIAKKRSYGLGAYSMRFSIDAAQGKRPPELSRRPVLRHIGMFLE